MALTKDPSLKFIVKKRNTMYANAIQTNQRVLSQCNFHV